MRAPHRKQDKRTDTAKLNGNGEDLVVRIDCGEIFSRTILSTGFDLELFRY